MDLDYSSTIIKSQNDYRDYKCIKLNNDLDVLVISDIKSPYASISMSVGTGSYDETDIPGLCLIRLTADSFIFLILLLRFMLDREPSHHLFQPESRHRTLRRR